MVFEMPLVMLVCISLNVFSYSKAAIPLSTVGILEDAGGQVQKLCPFGED